MENLIIAFRSRSSTMRYAAALRNSGIAVKIINTPREAGAGCGISARCSLAAYNTARSVLASGSYQGFAGFYRENPYASAGRIVPM